MGGAGGFWGGEVRAQVVDENDVGEEGAGAVDGRVVGLGVVGGGEAEGSVGAGDLELVVVGAGGVGENADAVWRGWWVS